MCNLNIKHTSLYPWRLLKWHLAHCGTTLLGGWVVGGRVLTDHSGHRVQQSPWIQGFHFCRSLWGRLMFLKSQKRTRCWHLKNTIFTSVDVDFTCAMKALIRWMLRTGPVHLKPLVDTAAGEKTRWEESVRQREKIDAARVIPPRCTSSDFTPTAIFTCSCGTKHC